MDLAAAPALDACPLCRTVLPAGARQCPGCGADLTPYLDAAQRVAGLTALARHALSRGETAQAAQVIPLLSRLAAVPRATLLDLQAWLALAQGDHSAAASLAGQLGGDAGAELLRQSADVARAGLQARELYNSALGLLHRGQSGLAAAQLKHAVELDPAEPRLWRLKLKADLKARLLGRCYADLAALDQLHARPPEFARLEALLPPTAGHAA